MTSLVDKRITELTAYYPDPSYPNSAPKQVYKPMELKSFLLYVIYVNARNDKFPLTVSCDLNFSTICGAKLV